MCINRKNRKEDIMNIKLNEREVEILKYILQSYNEFEGEYLMPETAFSLEVKKLIDRIQLDDLVYVRDDYLHNF